MNCAEFEIAIADYLDGTLQPGECVSLEQHSEQCAGCREFLADVTRGMTLLQAADEIEPPPALITRIAHQVPVGRVRHPFERQSLLSRIIGKWLQPVLQPRPVMGMAMTVLSFAMLEQCTGVRVQHLQPADLNPVRVWDGVEDKAFRVKDRAVKYYENLRFVYEIETRLKQLEEQQDAQQNAVAAKQPAGPARGASNSNSGGASQPAQGKSRQ